MDKQYDIRASRATYRNFAAPIVDVFASFINEGRPERAIPNALRLIEADADRYCMAANAFFAAVTRLTAAGEARFVIVDMEQKKGKTVAKDRASGRCPVPYFTSISPDDVEVFLQLFHQKSPARLVRLQTVRTECGGTDDP